MPRIKRFLQSQVNFRALLLAALLFPVSAVTAQDGAGGQKLRTVTVSGEGRIMVSPDRATLRFGIVSVDANPETASAMNARASADAMNAVRNLGIAEEKLKLEALRIDVHREFDQSTGRYLERGYEAVREVQVEVENLALLPELVADVVGEGANRINGVSYGLSNRRQVERDALRLAIEDARERAFVMVATLASKLGQVLTIREDGISAPMPILRMEQMGLAKDMAASAPEPDAYAGGEIEVTASVSLVFEIH